MLTLLGIIYNKKNYYIIDIISYNTIMIKNLKLKRKKKKNYSRLLLYNMIYNYNKFLFINFNIYKHMVI